MSLGETTAVHVHILLQKCIFMPTLGDSSHLVAKRDGELVGGANEHWVEWVGRADAQPYTAITIHVGR